MKGNKHIIQFGGLAIGFHNFEFELNDKFFDNLADFDVKETQLKAFVELEKQNTLLTLNIRIDGTIGIDCDRCFKAFDIPFETTGKLVIKHGDESESNEEILVVPFGANEADISQYLYEIVLVSLPARRVPCEISKSYKCDKEAINKLEGIETEEEQKKHDEDKNNPLWNKLKDINFNN